PAARAFEPDLELVAAGFNAHREDPLADCGLQRASFARMARAVRELAARHAAPLGVVLEGGYEPIALADSVRQTRVALGDGQPAESVMPEPLLTARAAAHVGRYWPV